MERVYSAISFFDLDKTLIKTLIGPSYLYRLYAYKLIPRWMSLVMVLNMIYYLSKYSLGLTSQREVYIASYRRIAKYNLLYKLKLENKAHLEQFLDELFKKGLSSKGFSAFQDAKRNSHYLVILSSAPLFLVEAFAKKINAHEYHGTNFIMTGKEVDVTTKPVFFSADEKVKKVREIASKLHIPIENTYGYSDSYKDIKFLEAVGVPIAINPDKKLRKQCKKRNWTQLED